MLWFITLLSIIIVGAIIYMILIYPQPELNQHAIEKLLKDFNNRIESSTQIEDENHLPLKGIRVLITGPTSGIGFTLAKLLYGLGATIIAIGRSPQRLENLEKELESMILSKPETKRIFKYTADFADLDSVQNVCKQILNDYSSIDFLINNAGVPNTSKDNGASYKTKQEYELVFGVNYLSHFLLSSSLLPLLEKSKKNPRIVYIASNFHRGVTGDELWTNSSAYAPIASGKHPKEKPIPMHAYANSKFAQLLHVRSINENQQQKHKNQKDADISMVQAVAVCPGGVRTAIHKGKKNLIASFSFPTDVSTQCIFYAMFAPLNTSNMKEDGESDVIDYLKNIPSLFCMKPHSMLSPDLRFKYLFLMAVITMPIQKFLFSHVLYHEKSDLRTYDKKRQQDLYYWSRKELSKWLK